MVFRKCLVEQPIEFRCALTAGFGLEDRFAQLSKSDFSPHRRGAPRMSVGFGQSETQREDITRQGPFFC
jgi:hypothetical protein